MEENVIQMRGNTNKMKKMSIKGDLIINGRVYFFFYKLRILYAEELRRLILRIR